MLRVGSKCICAVCKLRGKKWRETHKAQEDNQPHDAIQLVSDNVIYTYAASLPFDSKYVENNLTTPEQQQELTNDTPFSSFNCFLRDTCSLWKVHDLGALNDDCLNMGALPTGTRRMRALPLLLSDIRLGLGLEIGYRARVRERVYG